MVRFCSAGLLIASLLTVSCAQKSQAPESMALKLMRAQADESYKSEVTQKNLSDVKNVKRVAVVCCALQDQPQNLWKEVGAASPDLVIVAGSTVSSLRADEKPLAAQYKKLDQNTDYTALRATVPFMATWDEADYGIRNGDGSYSGKKRSREAFVKYWDYIPSLQPKRAQGVEHSTIFESNGHRVQVILLDTRFYSSSLIPTGTAGEFKKNWSTSGTLLGQSQWAWLKSELQKPADFRIVVSPLQIGANTFAGKRWGLFPHERQRFFDTLREAKAENVVVVSGGRGFSSFAKVDLIDYSPLYDVTVGPLNASTSTAEQDFHYLETPHSQISFALLEWDWNNKSANFKLVDDKGQSLQTLKIPFK